MSKHVSFPDNYVRSNKFIICQLEALLEKHPLAQQTQLLIAEQLPTEKSIQSKSSSELIPQRAIKKDGIDVLQEVQGKWVDYFGKKMDEMEEEVFGMNVLKRDKGISRKALVQILNLIKIERIDAQNKIKVLKQIYNLLAIQQHLKSSIISEGITLIKKNIIKLGFKVLNIQDKIPHKSKKTIQHHSTQQKESEELFKTAMNQFILQKKQAIVQLQYQICRMCESYVKASNMNAHLNYCENLHQKRYYQQKLNDKGKEIYDFIKAQQQTGEINQILSFFERSYRLLGQKHILFCLVNDPDQIQQIIFEYQKSELEIIQETVQLFSKYLEILKAKVIEGYVSDEEGKSTYKCKSKSNKSKHQSKNQIDSSKRSINISISCKNSDIMIESEHAIISDKDHLNSECIKYKLEDFEILEKLGQGSYSEVFLVRKKNTQDLFAMKVLIFEDVNEQNFQAFKKEQNVYKNITGGYNVKLYYSFSDSGLYFLILDYAPGGNLRQLLDEEVYLAEKDAKLYIANLILAVNSLHKIGIIDRDLKPENIVIDERGFLILTDFNLAKMLRERQNYEKKRAGFFGSPDYIAPQVLLGQEQTIMRDLFSVGVIAYEILTGARPFSDVTPQAVFDNILKGEIPWPEIGEEEGMISQDCQSFLNQMMHPNPKNRLGSKGLEEIKAHPFFTNFNWDNIDEYKPYYVPKQKQIPSQQSFGLRQRLQSHKKKTSLHVICVDTIIRYDILKNQTNKHVRSHRNSRFKLQKQLQALKLLNSEGNFKQTPPQLSFDSLDGNSSDKVISEQLSLKELCETFEQSK